ILLLVLALSGCATVPTTGEIEQVDATGRPRDPRVEIHVEPPQNDASPRLIISGFMQAMADYQTDYEVARQFLADEVRESWRPRSGAVILANDYFPSTTDSGAELQAPITGELGADDTFRRRTGTYKIDFKLVRNADGQWRVSNPPEGLLLTQYDFDQFYESVNLYFFEPGFGNLVPDPIFLPKSRINPTTLMQRLLEGPSEWLRPAVTTAIPPQTTLNVGTPIDDAGVAELSLSPAINGLNEQQRTLLATQSVWTLRQIGEITGVRFLMNGAPYVIRAAVDQVVSIDALSTYDPLDGQTSQQLFGVTGAGVVRLDDGRAGRDPEAVAGPLGSMTGVQQIAASTKGDQLAVITGGGRVLRTGVLAEAPISTPPLPQAAHLQRPQFTRFNELFVVGDSNGKQVLWRMVDGDVASRPIGLPGGQRVTALRISPDGVRAALIVENAKGKRTLGMMRMNRASGSPALEEFRPVLLQLPQGDAVSALKDVGWVDATTLMVLGAEGDDTPLRPYEVTQDGAELRSVGTPDNWEAEQLAVAPQQLGTRAAMVGRQGQTWRYADDYTWTAFSEDVLAIAFPG
ncbi:MAG: LpqB family beta-propeller domain-containing protein, partial [Propionibacteriales bacterium]|nr:LpqB family beta-propeller domain-containing protein [Propionibacteriales bacterium]